MVYVFMYILRHAMRDQDILSTYRRIPMTVKVGINGFGRIGRNIFRQSLTREDVDIVAVNDITDAPMLAHLLKYDSVHGTLDAMVEATDDHILVDHKEIIVLSEKDPANLTWGDLGIDIVIEATGQFKHKKDAQKHIGAGAKKVIISSPAKDEDVTIVMGVNEGTYDATNHHVVSNASCTTNCIAPFVKILHETVGIKRGLLTTVHSYTTDQQILDLPHRDYRRARAAAENIIPTTTGAAQVVSTVLPDLKGKLNGMAIRVPTPDGSIVDLVAEVNAHVTVEAINQSFQEASQQSMKGIVSYTEVPLVSRDIVGDTHSAIIDGLSTMVLDDNFIKVVAWYDNEMSYSARCIDLATYMKKQGF